MDQHTISSMMFCSSTSVCKVGATPADCRIETTTCWCLPGTFETLEAEGDGFVGRIVTGDETKKASKEWRHTSSPKPGEKKNPHTTICGKVMLTLSWDERGVILEHYMPRRNTVTNSTYADLLKNHLPPAIKSKWRGRLSTGVGLQHNNARPHTARSTVATIQDLSFECLPHLPYSPEPVDFHVFGPLKEAMGGKSFRSDEEVQKVVHEWLHSQQKNFFLEVSMHFRSAGTIVWNAMETT